MNGISATVNRTQVTTSICSENSIAVYNFSGVNLNDSAKIPTQNFSDECSLAAQPLVMNRFYILKNNDENYQIKAAIKRALTSSNCHPNIKRKIFENIMNIEKNILDDMGKRGDQPADVHYINAINELLDEIRASGGQIILDNTDFTGVNMKNLDFTGASAMSVKFNSMQMRQILWKNVDLSYARFSSTEIHACHFDDVTFNMAVFNKCLFVGGVLNDVTIIKTRFYETNFDHVIAPRLKTDDVSLRKKIAQSVECALTKNSKDPVVGDPNFQLYLRKKQFKLDLAREKFAQILNFKHSCTESQTGTLKWRMSRFVTETVPEFPGIVTEHVCQYAYEDSLWASQPLQTKLNTVIDSEENQTIKAAIKRELVSPDCDPAIKRVIFKNMMDFNEHWECFVTSGSNLSKREKLGENSYIQAINQLLAEIRDSDNTIILDDVDFTGINLIRLNLTGASAISAKFVSTQMEYVVWNDGDFAGAQFVNTNIMRSHFKNSVFNKSIHDRTLIHLSELTNTQMFGVEFHRTRFDGAFVNRLMTDDMRLRKLILDQQYEIEDLTKACVGTVSNEKVIVMGLVRQYCRQERTNLCSFMTCEYSTLGQAPKIAAKQDAFKKPMFPRLISQYSEGENIDTIMFEIGNFLDRERPLSYAVRARNLRFLGR